MVSNREVFQLLDQEPRPGGPALEPQLPLRQVGAQAADPNLLVGLVVDTIQGQVHALLLSHTLEIGTQEFLELVSLNGKPPGFEPEARVIEIMQEIQTAEFLALFTSRATRK